MKNRIPKDPFQFWLRKLLILSLSEGIRGIRV